MASTPQPARLLPRPPSARMVPFIYAVRPTLEAFLVEELGNIQFFSWKPRQRRIIMQAMAMGLFRFQNKMQIKRFMVKHLGTPAVKLLNHLWPLMQEHAILNTEYKLAVIQKAQNVFTETPLNAGFWRELETVIPQKLHPRFFRRVRRLGVMDPTIEALDECYQQVRAACRQHIQNLVHWKLRFISNSNRLGDDAFVNDLEKELLRVVRWNYPYLATMEHHIRSGKFTLNNESKNFISHWIAGKRSRLYQDEYGMSINRQLLISNHTETQYSYNPLDDIQSRMSFDSMIQAARTSKEKSALLLLSCRPHHCSFLDTLNAGRKVPFVDLHDAFNRLGRDRYLREIQLWLDMSDRHMDSLLYRLREIA